MNAETTDPTMTETIQNQDQHQRDSRQPRPLQRRVMRPVFLTVEQVALKVLGPVMYSRGDSSKSSVTALSEIITIKSGEAPENTIVIRTPHNHLLL